MPTLIRTTVAVLIAAAGIVGNAAASSALVVTTSQLVRNASAATIATREDPGTYRTTVFAPAAYQLPAVRHVGTTFGSALVRVSTPVGTLAFHGWLVGEDPASYTSDQCASFAGSAHLAVWLMELRQVNGIARAEIPVYVDAGPGGQTELTWCASSAADMTVTSVSLGLTGAFLNPLVPGAYTWHAGFDNANSAGRTVLGDVTASASATVHVHR
jgi:hypothetical protein